MYVALQSRPTELTLRPLPVEKSAGKVDPPLPKAYSLADERSHPWSHAGKQQPTKNKKTQLVNVIPNLVVRP